MKICVQTNPMVPRYGIDKGFEMIKAAGFDGVDFNFDSYCSYKDMVECKIPDIFTDEAKKEAFIEEMIASSKKHGIEIREVAQIGERYLCRLSVNLLAFSEEKGK